MNEASALPWETDLSKIPVEEPVLVRYKDHRKVPVVVECPSICDGELWIYLDQDNYGQLITMDDIDAFLVIK